jgi:ABC-type nickel/cobalt efflux system permease component RcnA
VLNSSEILVKHNRHGGRSVAWTALVFVVAMLFSMTQGAFAQTTNVFGRTDSGAPDAANMAGLPPPPASAASASASSPAGPTRHFVMPELLRRAVSASIRIQGRLDAQLQDILASQRDGTSRLAAWTLVALSFGYGVLHALGPGHGKLAVSAYLISHRARVAHAVVLSAWSACVQTLSAIVLVGGAAWLTRAGLSGVLTQASSLDLVSYIALLGVGLWTIWSIVTRRDCCDEVRVSLVPKRRFGVFAASKHRPDGGPNAGYLGKSLAKHRGRSQWTQADSRDGSTWIARQIFLTGLAVGIRPCVGAIFVLIAGLANGIFMIGVLSAFAMAAGVALTVFCIGLTSLGVNRLVSKGSGSRRRALEQVRIRLAMGGALFITLFAAWQVFAILIGWQATSLA